MSKFIIHVFCYNMTQPLITSHIDGKTSENIPYGKRSYGKLPNMHEDCKFGDIKHENNDKLVCAHVDNNTQTTSRRVTRWQKMQLMRINTFDTL